jgi:hypothetical protein
MALLSLPFPLPSAFLWRLGYRYDRRLVAVYWESAGDEAACTDGVHTLVGADAYVYWELTRQPAVQTWMWAHGIDLGTSDNPSTHWLLVNRATDAAYVCGVRAARERVKTQVLADWAG